MPFDRVLHIQLLTSDERCADINFTKVICADDLPSGLTVLTVSRDKRSNHNQTCHIHPRGLFGDAPDVFLPIFGGEAKISVKAMPPSTKQGWPSLIKAASSAKSLRPVRNRVIGTCLNRYVRN